MEAFDGLFCVLLGSGPFTTIFVSCKTSLQPLSAESKSGFGITLAGQTLKLERVDS